MLSSKVLLLSTVALLNIVQDASAVDKYRVKDLYSNEAKAVMRELRGYTGSVYLGIDELGNEHQNNNDASDALRGYQEMVEASRHTKCKPVKELNDQDVKEILSSYVDQCADTLPTDSIVKLQMELTPSKAKVKDLDDSLKTLAGKCHSKTADCEGQREQMVAELNHVLTAELKERFESLAREALQNANVYIDECFMKSADTLLNYIQSDTNKISTCLSKLS